MMRRIVSALILFYQKTLSFDHGPLKVFYPHGFCRFHPTCSEYAKQSILKYGIFKGGFKGAYRILRCHPWSGGGIDKP